MWQRIRTHGPRGGQPWPLQGLIRPHRPLGRLPGASQVLFCRTSCKDFCKKSVQRGGNSWPDPNPSAFWLHPAASCRILAILAFHFWVPKRSPKIPPKIPPKDFQNNPKNCKNIFFCATSAIPFSITLGSNFKLAHYSI